MTPIVSVVIPCYRQGRFLTEALQSVLAQTYPATEVIVVNDGSDDDTEEVARRFGPRVRYVGRPNGGPSAARNSGVEAATGDYLYFLDADDLIHPDALARLVEAAHADPPAVALMGYRWFRSDPARDGEPEVLPPPVTALLPLLFRTNFPCPCFLFPRPLVARVCGFDPALWSHEDWDLWLRIGLEAPPVVTVPLAGAYYRRHPAGASTNRERMARTAADVGLRVYRRVADDPALAAAHGAEMLRLLYAVRRRCLANRVLDGDLARQLAAAIGDLRGRHIRAGGPFLVRFQDRLPRSVGDAAERIAVRGCRWFFPRLHNALR